MEGETTIDWEISQEEEEMVDSLFLKCDTNQTGHVHVKTIIQYLNTFLGNESNEPDLSELSCILQESCTDGNIDIASYRTGVRLWIISIRNRCERFPVIENNAVLNSPGRQNHSDSLNSKDLSIETSSIGDGLFTKSEQDLGELLGEVQDLKYQNNRLMEDKEKLHEQLMSQEEAACQLTMQLDSHVRDEEQMRKKIKCLQDIGSLHEMAVDEIEELKNQLCQLQGTKRELEGQVTSLERENADLENQAQHFENKWQKSTKELDGIKKRVDQLQDTCEKQKELLLQSEELKFVNEEDVLKKSKEVEELTDRMKMVIQQNEKLLEEKSEVQAKLSEANTMLLRFHQADPLGLDTESFVDDNQHSEAAKLSPKHCYSTPLPKHSICMELKDRLNEDKHLPSPLCEKFELSRDVFGYRSAVLPAYMSAWELDVDSPGMSQQEFSLDMFKREPYNSEKYDFDMEKKLHGLKDLEKDALHKEIIQLYRVNVSLAEKCHKAELREVELEGVANETSEMAAADRQKCQQLQESLDSSRNAQQVELKDLYRLVHSVDEDEDDTQESFVLSVTTAQLQQQIRDDIEELKNKLNKQKAALSIVKSEEYQSLYKGKSSSSPLIDALALDSVPASNRSRYEDSQSSICCHSPSLLNRSVPIARRQIYLPHKPYPHGQSSAGPINKHSNYSSCDKNCSSPCDCHVKLNIGRISLLSVPAMHSLSCISGKTSGSTDTTPVVQGSTDTTPVVQGKLGDTSAELDEPSQDNNNHHKLRRKSYLFAMDNETGSVGEAQYVSYSFQSGSEHGHSSISGISLPSSTISLGDIMDHKDNISGNLHTPTALSWNHVPKFSSTPLPCMKSNNRQKDLYSDACGKQDKVVINKQYDDNLQMSHLKHSQGESSSFQLTALSVHDVCKSDGGVCIGYTPDSSHSSVIPTEDAQVIPDAHALHTTRHSPTPSQVQSHQSHQSDSESSSHLNIQAVPAQFDTNSHTSNQERSHSESPLEPHTASRLEADPVGQLDSWSSNQAASQPSLSPPEVWTLSGSSGDSDLSAMSRDSGHSSSIVGYEMRAPIQEMEDSSEHSNQHSSSSGLGAGSSNQASLSLSPSNCSAAAAGLSSMNSTSGDPRSSTTASNDGYTNYKTVTSSPRTFNIRSSWLGADSARNMSPSERILQHSACKQTASSVIKTSELPSKASIREPEKVEIEKCAQVDALGLQVEDCEAAKSVIDSNMHSTVEPIEIEMVQDDKHARGTTSGTELNQESLSPSQVEESSMKGPGMMNLQQQQQQQQQQTTTPQRRLAVNALKALGAEEGMVNHGHGSDKDTPKTASHLSKIRQNHLAKRRDYTQQLSKMPELSEQAEKEPADGNGAVVSEKPTNGQDGVVMPPPPSEEEVLPSIPDEYLRELGVSADNDESCDELSEQEIESKFSSLSLAFKTDAQTLEKRLEIQERARDIAEQNVDKELQGLRSGLATLNQICTDPVVREVLTKIQTHIDVLERSTARVSSRAEVFGAIQQEKRMSKAVDIMIHHVENLRRVHEREHAELEEARKLLQDSRSLGPSPMDMSGGDMLSRRSASVCPNNMFSGGKSSLGVPGSVSPSALKAMKLLKASRRRVSEIALPKVLGGSGAPNLQLSASMDHCFTDPRLLPRVNSSLRGDNIVDDEDEDPRSRFQAVVASTTVKSAVANTLRRASLEKQNNVQTISPTVTPPQVSRDDSTDSAKITDSQDKEKQKNLEEEAFKKGYEQGMRASLGQDLSSLREQQNQINESLGEIMDTIDSNNDEPKSLREILLERFHDNMPTVKISGWRIRLTMGCFFIVMAFVSVIVSLLPVTSADILHYRHVGPPVL